MPECVLDANVIVALMDRGDSLHRNALLLQAHLEAGGFRPAIVDVLLGEAVSVLCRRLRERRRDAELVPVLERLRSGLPRDAIRWTAALLPGFLDPIFEVVLATQGRLNFNDAFLVVLQREGLIGPLATFDAAFDLVDGFERIAPPVH